MGTKVTARDVTFRTLRDGTLLTAPRKMPLACGQPVFSSARFAVRLLPGAPRFGPPPTASPS